MRLLIGLVVFALASLTLLAAAQARPQTTAPTVFYNIHVTLTNSRIVLDKHSAPRGTYARFIIRNLGTRPHNFTLGKARRGTAHRAGSAGRSSRARN